MFEQVPGDVNIQLVKSASAATPVRIQLRLSYYDEDAPDWWRLYSLACGPLPTNFTSHVFNSSSQNAQPAGAPQLPPPSPMLPPPSPPTAPPIDGAVAGCAWPLASDANMSGSEDLLVSLNASGLAEVAPADAYVTQVGVEIERNGTRVFETMGISVTVAAVSVAAQSAWGAVPAKGRCAYANLSANVDSLTASPEGRLQTEIVRSLALPLSLCDFEGYAVAHGLPSTTDARAVSVSLEGVVADCAELGICGEPPTVTYMGGAVYYANLVLPHLGNFTVRAMLGDEPLGAPLRLSGACPPGQVPIDEGSLTEGHENRSTPVLPPAGAALRCGCPEGQFDPGNGVCEPCSPGYSSSLGTMSAARALKSCPSLASPPHSILPHSLTSVRACSCCSPSQARLLPVFARQDLGRALPPLRTLSCGEVRGGRRKYAMRGVRGRQIRATRLV